MSMTAYFKSAAVSHEDLALDTLVQVLGRDLETFEPIWRKWVMSLRR